MMAREKAALGRRSPSMDCDYNVYLFTNVQFVLLYFFRVGFDSFRTELCFFLPMLYSCFLQLPRYMKSTR